MGDNWWVLLIIMGVMIGGMYVWNMFSRKKQQTQQEEVSKSLVKGVKIMTIGGIVCTLLEINEKDNTMLVEMIPSGVQMTIVKNALHSIMKDKEAEVKEEEIVNYDDEK